MASAIIARLGLDSSEFTRGLVQAESRVKKFSGATRQIFGAIGGLIGVAGISQIAAEFDQIGKAAQKIGITAEEFQRLAHAANLSGINVDQLTNLLVNMNRRAGQAIAGNQQMADTFRELGTTAEDFLRMAAEDKMIALARGFLKAEESGTGTAAMMQLLETEAKVLFPLFRQGEDVMRETFESATVASNETVAAVEAANERLTELFQTIKVGAAEGIGLFSRLVEKIAKSTSEAGKFTEENAEFFGQAELLLQREGKIGSGPSVEKMGRARRKERDRLIAERARELRAAEDAREVVGARSRPEKKAVQEIVEVRKKEAAAIEDKLEMAKEQSAIDQIVERMLLERIEIERTLNEVAAIELDTARERMTDEERILSLEKERVGIVARIADSRGMAHAEAKKELAYLDDQLARERRILEAKKAQSYEESRQTSEEERQQRIEEQMESPDDARRRRSDERAMRRAEQADAAIQREKQRAQEFRENRVAGEDIFRTADPRGGGIFQGRDRRGEAGRIGSETPKAASAEKMAVSLDKILEAIQTFNLGAA